MLSTTNPSEQCFSLSSRSEHVLSPSAWKRSEHVLSARSTNNTAYVSTLPRSLGSTALSPGVRTNSATHFSTGASMPDLQRGGAAQWHFQGSVRMSPRTPQLEPRPLLGSAAVSAGGVLSTTDAAEQCLPASKRSEQVRGPSAAKPSENVLSASSAYNAGPGSCRFLPRTPRLESRGVCAAVSPVGVLSTTTVAEQCFSTSKRSEQVLSQSATKRSVRVRSASSAYIAGPVSCRILPRTPRLESRDVRASLSPGGVLSTTNAAEQCPPSKRSAHALSPSTRKRSESVLSARSTCKAAYVSTGSDTISRRVTPSTLPRSLGSTALSPGVMLSATNAAEQCFSTTKRSEHVVSRSASNVSEGAVSASSTYNAGSVSGRFPQSASRVEPRSVFGSALVSPGVMLSTNNAEQCFSRSKRSLGLGHAVLSHLASKHSAGVLSANSTYSSGTTLFTIFSAPNSAEVPPAGVISGTAEKSTRVVLSGLTEIEDLFSDGAVFSEGVVVSKFSTGQVSQGIAAKAKFGHLSQESPVLTPENKEGFVRLETALQKKEEHLRIPLHPVAMQGSISDSEDESAGSDSTAFVEDGGSEFDSIRVDWKGEASSGDAERTMPGKDVSTHSLRSAVVYPGIMSSTTTFAEQCFSSSTCSEHDLSPSASTRSVGVLSASSAYNTGSVLFPTLSAPNRAEVPPAGVISSTAERSAQVMSRGTTDSVQSSMRLLKGERIVLSDGTASVEQAGSDFGASCVDEKGVERTMPAKEMSTMHSLEAMLEMIEGVERTMPDKEVSTMQSLKAVLELTDEAADEWVKEITRSCEKAKAAVEAATKARHTSG